MPAAPEISTSITVGVRDYIITGAIWLGACVFYALLGVSFDDSTLPRYLQFLDVELLGNRLAESLLFYHANPPLLNTIAGIGLKLLGDSAGYFYAGVFYLMGLILALSLFYLCMTFTRHRLLSFTVTAIIVASPAFVLYQNWLMYTFITATLFTLSVVCLSRFLHTFSMAACASFFCVVTLLMLTRSIFHIVWLVPVIAALLFTCWPARRSILICMLIPLIVVNAWYAKNAYLFGTYSASSLLGLSLSNVSTLTVDKNRLSEKVMSGELSGLALVSRYKDLPSLLEAQPSAQVGVAAVDDFRKSTGQQNFNNLKIVAINQQYLADALAVIRLFPGDYARGVALSNQLFFSPSHMNLYFSKENRDAADLPMVVFNLFPYGAAASEGKVLQPHFGWPSTFFLYSNPGYVLIVCALFVLLVGGTQAVRCLVARDFSHDNVLSGYILANLVFVYLTSTLFELAENYRYKFIIEPVFWIYLVYLITRLIRHGKEKTKATHLSR